MLYLSFIKEINLWKCQVNKSLCINENVSYLFQDQNTMNNFWNIFWNKCYFFVQLNILEITAPETKLIFAEEN